MKTVRRGTDAAEATPISSGQAARSRLHRDRLRDEGVGERVGKSMKKVRRGAESALSSGHGNSMRSPSWASAIPSGNSAFVASWAS